LNRVPSSVDLVRFQTELIIGQVGPVRGDKEAEAQRHWRHVILDKIQHSAPTSPQRAERQKTLKNKVLA
jgi:hypothetical protein